MTENHFAYAAFSPGEIRRVCLPVPEPDDYEVLVKNEGCSFCNTTDRRIVEDLYASPGYPVLFGHESFGRVIRVGKRVTKYKLGDRVICANAVVTGKHEQYASTWGGFAQYGIAGDLQAYLADGHPLDEANAYRRRYDANFVIPGHFTPQEACLLFPLAEVASALKQVGEIQQKTVVVIGTGIVGYFFTLLAKLAGADRVICLGRRLSRLEVARCLGADEVYLNTPEELARHPLPLAHAVLECTGDHRVFSGGIPYLQNGGVLGIYGVSCEPYAMDFSKCPVEFSCKRLKPRVGEALDWVCGLMEQKRILVDRLLTHTWSFDQVPQAFEQVRHGQVIKGLVMID